MRYRRSYRGARVPGPRMWRGGVTPKFLAPDIEEAVVLVPWQRMAQGGETPPGGTADEDQVCSEAFVRVFFCSRVCAIANILTKGGENHGTLLRIQEAVQPSALVEGRGSTPALGLVRGWPDQIRAQVMAQGAKKAPGGGQRRA